MKLFYILFGVLLVLKVSSQNDVAISLSSTQAQMITVNYQTPNGAYMNPPFNQWTNGVITLFWPNATAGGPGDAIDFEVASNNTPLTFIKQGEIVCVGDVCYQKFILPQANYTYSLQANILTPLFTIRAVQIQRAPTNFDIVQTTTDIDGGNLSLNNVIWESSTYGGGVNNVELPVDLTVFNVQKQNFHSFLTWETASEINNDYFDVERSSDGVVFEKIGKVVGNGTTTEVQNYEFTDRTPFAELNYYRLKQVDFNGEYEYSKVETVDFRVGTEGDVKIFPNPAVDYVNIVLDRKYDGVKVTNQLGQLVANIPQSEYEFNSIKLNVSDYTPGIYYLEAKLGTEIVNKQFVKVK